ncbi:MAG TPA: hypothetical protein PKE47_04960, partial [Verrucomicrobiota bacterium]|nr:hypothetical protein [Verrucomicrobiota bacterium]
MKLPHADRAWVDKAKLTQYLLAEEHPAGGAKARFFLRNGFSRDRWDDLANRLVDHGRQHEVAEIRHRPGGRLFAITGSWRCADGALRPVTTV